MTPPSRQEAMLSIQRVAIGETPPDAPTVRAALAAFPDLADTLRELQALQAQLGAFTNDAAEIEELARQQATAQDVATVRRHLASRPRARTWPLLLAAVLLCGLAIALWPRGAAPAVDGHLGDTTSVRIDRSGQVWSIDPGVQLPPGGQYAVTLEVDGRATGAPKPFAWPILLPSDWQQAIDQASTAVLVVEVPELGSRQRIVLR